MIMNILSLIFFKADRVRREKLRRKREEEEGATATATPAAAANKNDSSSRIVEVTDEEAEKITRENAQAKVKDQIYTKNLFIFLYS